jgi:predicted ABC-type ATPase
MPSIIIVAGPNGAGKTTFANNFLRLEREMYRYINADQIAREPSLADFEPAAKNIRAARIMLDRLDEAIRTRSNIMFETTLASLSYAQKIPGWQSSGYTVSLFYLRLPNPDRSIERVRRRVAEGGHGIPEDTIRQRFRKSLDYLETHYKPIVDQWYVCDSVEHDFILSEQGPN